MTRCKHLQNRLTVALENGSFFQKDGLMHLVLAAISSSGQIWILYLLSLSSLRWIEHNYANLSYHKLLIEMMVSSSNDKCFLASDLRNFVCFDTID